MRTNVIAWLGIIFGSFSALAILVNPSAMSFQMAMSAGLMLTGIGVLCRSNLARILSSILHALIALSLLLFSTVLLVLVVSAGPDDEISKQPIAVHVALLAGSGLVTAYFVWAAFVLAGKNTRAACRRPAR